MDGRVDGGGGGSALAEEGRVTSSVVREGEGGGRGRRGGGREDGRTAGWPRWRHPCGAREQGQRWPTGTSVASASVAVWQTPPMHPLLPLRSSPALTPWRATPPPAEHAPLRESDRPSPPPPPPPRRPHPLFAPVRCFFPLLPPPPVEEFIHGSNLGRPVSAKKCTASGRHGIPRFHVPYTYTYMYMYMYIYTRFYTFPYTATQPASFFSSLLLLPPSPTSPSFEL